MLVVGGDGTIGWILSVLDGLQQQFAAQPDPMHWGAPASGGASPGHRYCLCPTCDRAAMCNSVPLSLLQHLPSLLALRELPAGGAAACGNAPPAREMENGMTLGRHARCDHSAFQQPVKKSLHPWLSAGHYTAAPERRRVGRFGIPTRGTQALTRRECDVGNDLARCLNWGGGLYVLRDRGLPGHAARCGARHGVSCWTAGRCRSHGSRRSSAARAQQIQRMSSLVARDKPEAEQVHILMTQLFSQQITSMPEGWLC